MPKKRESYQVENAAINVANNLKDRIKTEKLFFKNKKPSYNSKNMMIGTSIGQSMGSREKFRTDKNRLISLGAPQYFN
jgi:hypothetical protein